MSSSSNESDDDKASPQSNASSTKNSVEKQATPAQNLELSDSDAGSPRSSASSSQNEDAEKQATTPVQHSDDDEAAQSDDGGQEDPPRKSSDDAIERQERVRQKFLLSDSDDDDEAGSKKSNDGDQVMRELVLSDSDTEAVPEPETIVDEIPSNRLKLGDLGPVFMRLPNFLSIEPRPFERRTYDPEVNDDEVVDAKGRSRMKLKIENTIRWRNILDPKTGEIKKQSNAKIVKWSDGTTSLYLGNEIFEVQNQKAMPNLHLFTRQGASLQAQSAFDRKFTFRPHSTDTLTHRKMTMNMADKSNRIQKVKMVTDVGMNPEKARTENIKREEEKLRALARKQADQRRKRERTREQGITSNFLEGGDDSDDGENVGALKRAFGDANRGGINRFSGAYSDESENEEEQRTQKLLRARVIDSSDEEGGESQSTEPRASTSEQRTKSKIIDDD